MNNIEEEAEEHAEALRKIAGLLGLEPGCSTEDVVQMAWNAWARGIHSCSHNCTRPLCVSRKEVERLTELAEKWAVDARDASERADAAEAIIAAALRELPVGNINTHTPESLAERVAYLVKEQAEAEQRADAAEARLRAVADALLDDVTRQQGGAK